MKKILCPTDFSETALGAMEYAANFAKATGCDLSLLHVKSIFDFSLAEKATTKHLSTSNIAEQLEEQSREISKTFKISCDSEVVEKISQLSSVINDVAKDYDLIVMGTDGPDNLYEFFTGSNTYNTIVKSKTPLLLIPTGCTYNEIKSVVYAYDYLHERNLPLTILIPFLKAFNAKLTVLQVMEEAYSKKTEDDLKEFQILIRNFYRDDLNCEYDTIYSTEIAQSINSYILKNKPDVLALCSEHRNLVEKMFHKSIIKNISVVSNYPVYISHQ